MSDIKFIACGPEEVAPGECVECGGSATLGGTQEALIVGAFPYCSTECYDQYEEYAARAREVCTVCGNPKGRCSTDHPEDPHEYEQIGTLVVEREAGT